MEPNTRPVQDGTPRGSTPIPALLAEIGAEGPAAGLARNGVIPEEAAADSERIADLERQLADLRRDFHATKYCLDRAFDAGRASALPGTAPRPAARAARHLRAVGGLE